MPADLFAFGPFELDPSARRLLKDGEPLVLPPRQFDLLVLLVSHAGQVLPKDVLVSAAWAGVAVTDNSLEQAISGLRRALVMPDGASPIETQARRGYRFVPEVRRLERRLADSSLEALLAPHRAWVEGRAALETLERAHIAHARAVFEALLAQVSDQAPAHVGLANACIMQFEMTRSDPEPDRAALGAAVTHAREACRLDPRYGEAWATLGFVLDRTGHRDDALAASRMAVSLEPDNWRHQVRLAYVGWGEERLRGARRALALLPAFPMAHWLAATVLVARQAFDEAERELRIGLQAAQAVDTPRFSSVALHWLLGLLLLRRGDEEAAFTEFDRELAQEPRGQLYAKECCSNVWYAKGVVLRRRGDRVSAAAAFTEALARVPHHPVVRLLTAWDAGYHPDLSALPSAATDSAERLLAEAGALVLAGDVPRAAEHLDARLTAAPPGSTLWVLPVDPLLTASDDPRWAAPLARLRNRAA